MHDLFPEEEVVGVEHYSRSVELDGNATDADGGLTGGWEGNAFTHTVRDFCASCNNGWMAATEEEVKALISGAMRGEPMALSVPDQYLLATWAVKTALVIARAIPGGATLVPAELYAWFGANRVPPPRSVVSLGYYVGGEAADGGGAWPLSVHLYGANLVQAGHERDDGTNAFNCTFAVGHLAFCVFVPHLAGDPDVGEPALSPHRVKIWPSQTERSWPPKNPMNDELLKADAQLFPGLP
jgi:hypothetical protein